MGVTDVTITRSATLSIKRIFTFKAENDTVEYARKWRRTIFEKIKYLENNPQMGKKIEEWDKYPNEIRYLIEGNYHIFYEYTGQKVFVHKVKDSRAKPEEFRF